MYPRTTHSSGSISSVRHSVERPSGRRASRWFETSSRVRANQNADSPVRTRPLSGISVGRTTSKVEMRSLATSSSRSSSIVKSSRTFPLATCTSVSDTDFLLGELVQTVEDGVGVACVGAEVEGRVEVDAAGVPLVVGGELLKIEALVPRAQGMLLDEPVGLVAREPALDERE